MKSIQEIYKIGKGPSSSHTMGPERAARLFRSENPQADSFQVILYGSLSKTGVGHGTDRVLRETLAPLPTEIVFSEEILPGSHPNTLDFIALKDGREISRLRVESIGGGDIRIPGREDSESEEIYVEHSFAEIADFCKWRYIHTLSDYVELNEGSEIWDFLLTVWQAMKQSIEDGLNATGVLPGGLGVQRKANYLYNKVGGCDAPALKEFQKIAAYAYAVAEQNADNGTIVTAPTCGSCGVLPAVLYHLAKGHKFSDTRILHALATAGIFGNVVKQNASISGADVGCQGEVGVACAMASAAACQLFGGSPSQIEYAAEMGLEHHLGMTCDPVCGLVQIPCIERNAFAATRALDANLYASFSDGTHSVSFDRVVKVMKQTGHDLPSLYKETSTGGLAQAYEQHMRKIAQEESSSEENISKFGYN